MSIYSYTAYTPEGELKKGSQITSNKADLHMILESQGLTVVSIEEEKLTQKKQLSFSFGKIKLGDLVMMIKQLSVMIRAGIDMGEAISILQVQSLSKRVRNVMGEILKSVEGGLTLAGALAEHPKDFPDIIINMVRAGEMGGHLEENLDRLAIQLEKDYEVKRKVRDAMIYPGVIVSVALILGIVMSLFVLPKLVKLFDSFSMELPITTKIIIWFSAFMQKYGIIVIVGMFIAFIGLRIAAKTKYVKPYIHRIILTMPFVSKVSRSFNLARFTRTLGTLLKSGIPIVEALKITAHTVENAVYRKKLEMIAREAQKGISLSDLLKAHEGGPASF
ncbi:MAG: type II secretion system F family protein, partial [Patescibacteria group bacterium]